MLQSLLYPTSWQKVRGFSPQLGQGRLQKAGVAVLSPGWRLCLRLLFRLRQPGTPSADACHQLPSRLGFLISPATPGLAGTWYSLLPLPGLGPYLAECLQSLLFTWYHPGFPTGTELCSPS